MTKSPEKAKGTSVQLPSGPPGIELVHSHSEIVGDNDCISVITVGESETRSPTSVTTSIRGTPPAVRTLSPVRGMSVQTEVQPGEINYPLDDLLRTSALYVRDAIEFSGIFRHFAGGQKSLSVAKRAEFSDRLFTLAAQVAQQNTWLNVLAERLRLSGCKTVSPSPVRVERSALTTEYATTPKSSRGKVASAADVLGGRPERSAKTSSAKAQAAKENSKAASNEKSNAASAPGANPEPNRRSELPAQGAWIKVVRKKRKRGKRGKHQELVASGTAPGSVKYLGGTGSPRTSPESRAGGQKPSRQLKPLKPPTEFALLVRPKDTSQPSHVTRKALVTQIDPMKEKLRLRGMRDIASGGVIVLADSDSDRDKLLNAIKRLGLDENLDISMPTRRDPEIILFGVDKAIAEGAIAEALRTQNEALNGATLKLRTTFQGKRGRNAIVSVDAVSLKALGKQRKLKVGWGEVDFRRSERPLVCYQCWKYGHIKKHCKGSARCGRCGGAEHVLKDCQKDPACPNCTFINARHGSKRDTRHVAGSRECPVFQKELALVTARSNGE